MSRDIPRVACSLDASSRSARRAEWEDLLRFADLREEIPNGARYTFPAVEGIEERAQALAGDEKQCCPFFDFRVSQVGDRVEMTVMAPAPYRQTSDGQETFRLFAS